jgi:hypothetical protein
MTKPQISITVAWIIFAGIPLWGQPKLYPVRTNRSLSTVGNILVQADPKQNNHYVFLAEKSFDYRLRLGFPNKYQAEFLTKSDSPIAVLWLRVENLSQNPLNLDTSRFTAVDEQGKGYARLSPEEASNRIAGNKGAGAALQKTLRTISIGRAGNAVDEEAREEISRFSLQSVQIPPRSIREGFIFFEVPERKKFTLNVNLDGLWPQPFVFANTKPKY